MKKVRFKSQKFTSLVVCLIALGGCSVTSLEEVGEVPEVLDTGGFDVAGPGLDDVVLTVKGDTTVDFLLRDLDNFEPVETTVIEPFVLREITFKGIYLEDVLSAAGVPPNALIDTVALNEYRYSDEVSALINARAILAYLADGEPIPFDEGGPLRIVFHEDSFYFSELSAWNWSLRTIEVLSQ